MIRIGFFKLVVLSVIWLSVIFVISNHDLQHITLTPNIDQIDIQRFMQMGILPVVYAWMIFISLKIIMPAKNA